MIKRNSIIITVALSLCASGIIHSQSLGNESDSLSYSAGMIMAKSLKGLGVTDVNQEAFMKAFMAVLEGEETQMKPSEAEMYLAQFQTKQQMMIGEANRIAGEQFLAENAKREGVISLDNGLQYEVLTMGDGAKPAVTDKVYTHYHGMLIDGTVFDSSVERGEPIEFPLNRVIRGWTEILQLMPVGSKWRVYIPYDLAYGERGAGGVIGPYSALIFDIELIEIR